MSGSGIRWAICKSAPCSRQITTPAPHQSVFYRPDALPATQPTASKYWRLILTGLKYQRELKALMPTRKYHPLQSHPFLSQCQTPEWTLCQLYQLSNDSILLLSSSLVLFCSSAVLDPRVGHTMDVLSLFTSVLCHSNRLFHGESCPCLNVVHPGRAWPSSPACTWHCSLHYLFLHATPLLSHGVLG